MRAKQYYDIAIVGAGITGLSTAYSLSKLGSEKICILHHPAHRSQSLNIPGMLSGGLIDNYTRIHQRHGPSIAQSVWSYSHGAFDQIVNFAHQHAIPLVQGQRHRLLDNPEETVEAEKAIALLNAADFSSHMQPASEGTRTLYSVQSEGQRSGQIDNAMLLRKLHERLIKPSIDFLENYEAQRLISDASGVTIETDQGAIGCEVVVLANHLGIGRLLPAMSSVLVSSQDQWHRLELSRTFDFYPPGSLLTWRHGHYWALIENQKSIVLGGARFVRPMAGFEAQEPQLEPKVEAHLIKAWNTIFPDHILGKSLDSKAGLDIRPCDEIPVIGPMFGENRILVATGYMGQGLSLGFAAGHSLAQLVHQKTNDLPRIFWPERHRSLEN